MSYQTPMDRLASSARRLNGRPARRVATWRGLPVKVEIEAGDYVSGVGEDGRPWGRTYSVPYGEIPHSRSLADGDAVDVYLGPRLDAPMVYVIHQRRLDGSYDEDKCMLGFASQGDAVLAYKQHGPSWGFGSLDTMTADQFVHGYLASNRKWNKKENQKENAKLRVGARVTVLPDSGEATVYDVGGRDARGQKWWWVKFDDGTREQYPEGRLLVH